MVISGATRHHRDSRELEDVPMNSLVERLVLLCHNVLIHRERLNTGNSMGGLRIRKPSGEIDMMPINTRRQQTFRQQGYPQQGYAR
jgi:hypothetical protein